VVFVEDFHKATPLVEKLIEGLVRARAAFLIITTAWPGELEQRKQLKTLFSEEMLQSRILRIRHDGNMPASFPKGASMGELSEQDLRKVVLAYYPKADSETLERLASRYNNPLPLELVCTLPKYQKKFSDGALKLKPGEIDSLPNRVEDLYRELWNALPLIAKQALALSTLGIPDNDAIWDSSLIRRTIKKCDALDANDAIAEILEKDCIPHGWVRVIQSWLRRFNEPDQLHIARNYVGDHFFQEDIDRFLDHLADELEARTFDSAKPEAQNHARLVLFLHKDGKIEDIHALKAICFLLETLRTLPLELAECIKIGEYLKNLKVEENSNELMEGYANYAFALGEAGRLGEALQQFEALLPDQVRILGADHPRTLVTRNNIASLLAKSGRVEEALKQFEDLLRDKVQRLGANHPSTLTTRNNIATWLGESGQVEEALKQFKDLLRDEARLLGADHPSTLETRSNIAFGLGESGQVEEALKQFEDLLRDEIRILGADHPNTLATRHNIASWLGDSGRVEEALRQYEELLPDEVRILGADHSNTLSTRNNIASRLGELGRIEEALKQFEELLRDKLRILGADHPSTLATRHNMASWLGESGQVEESLKQFENLLRDELRIMGADHPRALATRSNIASCLGNSGRVDEALKQLEELLLDKLRILGADHPSTLTTRNNIAFWLVESGKEKEALIHFQKLLQDKLRIFGADHPSTLRTHRNMVKLTQKLP